MKPRLAIVGSGIAGLGAAGVDTTGLEQAFPDSGIDQLRSQLEPLIAGATATNAGTGVQGLADSAFSTTLDTAKAPVAVPEPATIASWGAGLGLLVLAARRR